MFWGRPVGGCEWLLSSERGERSLAKHSMSGTVGHPTILRASDNSTPPAPGGHSHPHVVGASDIVRTLRLSLTSDTPRTHASQPIFERVAMESLSYGMLKVILCRTCTGWVAPAAVARVTPTHQPDAKWPVYLFELGGPHEIPHGGGPEGGGSASDGCLVRAGVPKTALAAGEHSSAKDSSIHHHHISSSSSSSSGSGGEPACRSSHVPWWSLGAAATVVVAFAVHRHRAGRK